MAIRNSSPAFTLIEVLIAMVIMALGFISIASIFPVALFQQRRAMDDTQATIIGHNVLAMLHQEPSAYFSNLSNPMPVNYTPAPTASLVPPVPAADSLYTDPSGVYAYHVAWRQLASAATPNPNPIEIAVFVYRAAAARSVSLTDPTLTAITSNALTYNDPYYANNTTIATPNIFFQINSNPTPPSTPPGPPVWPNFPTPAGEMYPATASNPLLRAGQISGYGPGFAPGDRNQVLLCEPVVGPQGRSPPSENSAKYNVPSALPSTTSIGTAFVTRTFQDNYVDSTPSPYINCYGYSTYLYDVQTGYIPPLPAPIAQYYLIYYLPQKAVAIITGTYP